MASDSKIPSVTLTAHCLCRAHTFTTVIPVSKLPLPASACHCTSCRHFTGALYSIDVPWPASPSSVDISGLKSYAFTPSFNVLFCGTCSTPMFFDHEQDPNKGLGVFTGTLQNIAVEGDLVNITEHIFVEDTLDGGATMWMRKINADGSEAKRYKTRDFGKETNQYPFDWPAAETLSGHEAKKQDAVPIRCRCKGVDFILHRGDYTGTKKEDLPGFIDPRTHKPLAGFCACDSCRLAAGVDIVNWVFSSLSNISYASAVSNEAFPKSSQELKALVDAKDARFGTLTYFSASLGVQRYFCSTCSACVFFATDRRPETIDIALGVLEAQDGARAEGFVSWAFGEVGHVVDTKGGWREGLMGRVEEECEAWREKRAYPKFWERVEREEAEKERAS